VRTGIGNTALVIGGEVDAGMLSVALGFKQLTFVVWDSKPCDDRPINWVELKTSADIRNDRDMITFERKLMKFWIQSFLLGVPKIIVGFRTPDGILKRVEEMVSNYLPGLQGFITMAMSWKCIV
jgi:RAT1-interacting protein